VVGCDPRLVLARVRPQRPPVGVPERIQPLRARNAQVLVDLNVTARRQADRLQTELVGARMATDSDQQPVALALRAVLQAQHQPAVTTLGTRGAHAEMNLDAELR
jgi:hypothetical protein